VHSSPFEALSADDFFSSPEWSTSDSSTDPSPALSAAFDFSSCDATPLLEHDDMPLDESYDAYAALPLFGGAGLDGFADSKSLASLPLGGTTQAEGMKLPLLTDAAALLNAFGGAALHDAQAEAPTTVSGAELLAVEAASTVVEPAVEAPAPTSALDLPALHGIKRRATADELLPLDAPIQARHYASPSSTSRKAIKALPARKRRAAAAAAASGASTPVAEATPASPEGDCEASFALAEAKIAATRDPVAAKRLSNTLAARRSRHRKAEELKTLHDTIAALKEECEGWKRRCLALEAEQ
jgi:hypothetical protein